ncbi:MAG: aldo/keto reductase [Devosia sp.]|nr:aldo/keto reductase [Devosia sp.]
MQEKHLPNQYGIPQLGFGTFGRNGEVGVAAILTALETGYRHIDTAQTYDTEAECGTAFRRSGLARQEVFFTTKISTDNLDPGRLVPSLRRSLDALQLDRADLVLIHWPAPNERLPVEVYVEQLADAQALGLTRLVGVSNFTIAHLTKAKAALGTLPIANNQFEMNPYLQNGALVSYCTGNDISVTCYLPIARGRLAGDPVLQPIARRHDASVEQIALAWEMQRGLIAIPTSGRPERIRSNFRATQIRLAPAEMQAIDGIARHERQVDPPWGPAWDEP